MGRASGRGGAGQCRGRVAYQHGADSACHFTALCRWRKELHLKHHEESGQVTDVEERLIGLGLVGSRVTCRAVTPITQ
jgi:hypothetical protein